MNREELNKAAMIAASNYDNPFDEPCYDPNFYDGFIACADWLMQQPLSERLTEEEREKVQNLHKALNEFIYSDECRKFFAYMLKTAIFFIESIFGAEIFNNIHNQQTAI